ncbi:uncharacterized protein LOC120634111 [Pararge aegeria]|uniref:uncharacterized protein LOC120634111 n=1 Tax=Pararge aegeria TaxID=116150 RepID=UPI0019CFE71F|nr:uncharacterized protein LOC120634111 [Pararge aegeria]
MNLRRILSKSSLRSSPSSKKISKLNEINTLQDEIESLKLNLSSFKVLLEGRDASIGNLAREKEKLYVEHKNLQRINRKLQQELIDERVIHSKEKDFLLENIKKLSLKLANIGLYDDILDEEEHISALQNEIKSKDEVIYNVCSKYFKLKKSKGGLKKKFDALQTHMHKTFENIITTLEDNKNSLDILLDDLSKSAYSNPSHKKYVKLIKINAELNFENTQLKLFLIENNGFSNQVKKAELPGLADPQCSRSDRQLLEVHKNLQTHKSLHSIEKWFRRSKSSATRVLRFFNKLKNTNTFTKNNRKIGYRSMSDSFLPRNFYK